MGVRLWRPGSPAITRAFWGLLGPIRDLAFAGNGRRLAAVADRDPSVRVWDVRSGESVAALSAGEALSSVAVSPDGLLVAAGTSLEGTTHLWRVDDAYRVRSFEGHALGVTTVAFSPDGRRVLTAGADWVARVWDVADVLASLKPEIVEIRRETDTVRLVVAGRWGGASKLVLESTADVTVPESWQEVREATASVLTDGRRSFVVSAVESHRFLRVRLTAGSAR